MSAVDDEYWYQCSDCEGEKVIYVPDGLDESTLVEAQCPGCDGSGVMEGDADDEQYGYIRVPN